MSLSNPFKLWHPGSFTSSSSSLDRLPPLTPTPTPNPPMLPNPKRETVYLTPQQVRETLSAEDRALIDAWPEPERPKAQVQWTGTVGFHAHAHAQAKGTEELITPREREEGLSDLPVHLPEDIPRTESPYDPRALPRLRTTLVPPTPTQISKATQSPAPASSLSDRSQRSQRSQQSQQSQRSLASATSSRHSSKPSSSSSTLPTSPSTSSSLFNSSHSQHHPSPSSPSLSSRPKNLKPTLASVFRASAPRPSSPPLPSPSSPLSPTPPTPPPKPASGFAGSRPSAPTKHLTPAREQERELQVQREQEKERERERERESTSNSYAGSDISISAMSTLTNKAIPTPYGYGASGAGSRTRKRTSSSDDQQPTRPMIGPPGSYASSATYGSTSNSYNGPGTGGTPPSSLGGPARSPAKAEGKSMFGRLRQKMSSTSLRSGSGRSQPNGGEPIPPLPVRTSNASTTSLGSKRSAVSASASGGRTPTSGSFGAKAWERKAKPGGGKAKPGKRGGRSAAPSNPKEAPIDEEESEDDAGGFGRATSYFEELDLDHLNPEEFMSFEAVSEPPERSSVDTLGAPPAEELLQGRLSIATESTGPGPGRPIVMMPRQSQSTEEGQPSLEWEIPDSWAVLTEEALAKEEGLESEAEGSEDEDEGGAGGILFLENSEWVEEDGEVEEGEEEEEPPLPQVVALRGADGDVFGDGDEEMEEGGAEEDTAAKLYALRVYRPNGTWHVVACPLTATAYDIRNCMVERFGLENEGMIGRYRLFIVEKGQERMLMKKEKPLVILRRRLLTAGHTKLDKLTSQGGRELQHLCRFVLQMSLLHGLPEEHDGMFDHLQGLVKLEDFNLQTIPAELHKAAPQLLRLSLRNNPLTDLPKDFCMATTQLKELNLSRTALKRIPAAVSYCTSLETLDVSYNRVKSLDMTYGSLENLKQLKTLRLHANILSDLPSSIADLPLQELRLDMNRFRHLPSVVCQLALLETLVLSHNDLETLPADIGTLTQLRILLAMGNNLHYLPSEMKGMTSLVYLNVSRNRLGDIAVISALPSLQHLEASHNSISSVPAFPKALKNVNLEANHFTRFNPAAKMLMTRAILRKLDMSHTKLSALQFDFAVFPDLQDLNVDDSRIGELPSSILKLDRLIKLSACNASLKFLPDALGDLPSLSELLVHSNDLRALPHSIWCCSSLRVFNASSNKLSTFPDAPQAKDETLPPLVKSMKELYLANNDLEGSALVPLSLFKHLTVLNVSYNKIRDIPHQTLWCLIRLEALFLSGNGLQTIRQGDLPPTASLARLYLNNNRLVSLPHEIEKYSKLAVLDVGNNSLKYNIHNYRFDYQWIWNDALQMLNLSGNMFLKIDKLRSVEKGIDRPQVNAADFRLLKNLQSLGLTDVTLAVTYLPEESDHCRIRTSASSLNGMRYSVSDSLGKDLMGTFDMAVSRFRGHEDECIFGIFSRELPAQTSPFQESNALTYYLFTHFRSEFSKELLYIKRDPKLGDIRDAMRRTFLNLNKGFYDSIVNPTGFEIPIKSSSPFQSGDPATRYPELQTGACACVAYLVDKTLYIANVGNVEALVGAQDGKMRVSTTLHVPFEAREAGRIKRAEEWVAPKGILKGEPKVSRAFGFYSKFPVVNPGPDIMKIQLSPDDHFIVIGNAEFWTYLNKDAAAKIIWDIDQAGDEMSAAQALRDVALAHGASGNAQVMVIMLSDLFHPPSTKKNGGQVNKFGRRTGGSGMIHRMAGLEEAPSGPMALCFTDVRNSTALYERLPGEGTGSMHSSLKLHNTCLRRLIRLCDGYEIKTEGDAFIVAFKSVLAAVHWCLKGQEELLTLDWPAALLNDPDGKVVTDADGVVIERGLMVRMGIHYGVPTASDLDPTTGRMDYFGSAVNRAARVGSSPKAGEIMLSAEVMKMLQPYRIEEPSTAANSSATDSRNALPSEESLNTPEVDEDQRHLEAIRELNPVLIPAGERMLKGIEQPEFLTRLFPRRLLGRAKTESADTQGAPVAPAKSEADPDALGMISRESVESLALVCRRLEALDAGRIFRLVEGADEHPTPDAQSQPLPGTATPGDSSKRSSETESHIVHGRLGQFLPTVDYSDESQVMQVMEGLIKRLEDSIKRLKAREALSDPVIRQLMHEKLGFDPEELLLLIGDATARLRGTHTQYLVGPQSPVPFA